MECILCNKQYVGKAETKFNKRLNNYRKDVKKVDAILTCKHFQQESHIFKENFLRKLSPSDLSKKKVLYFKIRYAIRKRF